MLDSLASTDHQTAGDRSRGHRAQGSGATQTDPAQTDPIISEAELIDIENRLLNICRPRKKKSPWGEWETINEQEFADVKRLLDIIRRYL